MQSANDPKTTALVTSLQARQGGRTILGLVAGLMASLFMLTTASAQDRPPAQAEPAAVSEFGGRYDGLRLLFLEQLGEKSTPESWDEFQSNQGNWKGWIVVVLGDNSILDAPMDQNFTWEYFVKSGGSLLIASSQRTGQIMTDWKFHFAEGPVEAPKNSQYQGHPFCIEAKDFARTGPTGTLVKGVNSIVLNRAGYLVGDEPANSILGFLPNGSQTKTRTLPRETPFIAAGRVQEGRILLLADESVFINEMILEGDNAVFARNTISWLLEGKDPSTLKVMVLENGQPIDRWLDERFVSGDWSGPTPAKLLGMINEVIAGMQKENLFNEVTRQQDELIMQSPGRLLILIVPTLLLLTYLFRRAYALRDDPKVSVNRSLALESGAAADLAGRRAEVQRRGNYVEPARRLAEEFFSRTLESGRIGSVDARVLARSYWSRLRLRRKIQRLERLARGEPVGWISARSFRRLRRDVAELFRRIDRSYS